MSRFERASVAFLIAGLIATFYGLRATTEQLSRVNDQMASSASQAIFTQQQEIHSLFLDEQGEELYPYFFEDQKLPPNNEALSRRATLVASSMLDFFSHMEDQEEASSFVIDYGWETYIRSSFDSSPVLCDTLLANWYIYGGEESRLWNEFAADSCYPPTTAWSHQIPVSPSPS